MTEFFSCLVAATLVGTAAVAVIILLLNRWMVKDRKADKPQLRR